MTHETDALLQCLEAQAKQIEQHINAMPEVITCMEQLQAVVERVLDKMG